MDSIIVAFGVLVVIIVVLAIFFSFFPVGLWISALASGVKIRISTLVGMRIRRITPSRLVYPLIKATKAGLDVSIDKMEAHYLAGGNIDRVINALIAAQRADIDLVFERAAAIDLAGRDVLQAVQMSVNPKVIETPVVAAIAKDGIELRAKARVTVRANIDRLVGGAGEETVIARVGEGIVTTVGSAESHKQVLENPDMISRTVLSKGLDAGTAFEILSIDIADVDVGRNIGAQLQTDQAEADKRIAQAKAEERRAMAVAHEQEMVAAVQEMRAKVEIYMRKRRAVKRDVLPDPIYKSKTVAKLTNTIMLDGKKGTAQTILYEAFDMVKDKTGRDPLEVFNEAMDNIRPALEVKSRRVGGANYQVPQEVTPRRAEALALRWLVKYSRLRGGRGMADNLASEIIDAANGTGAAVKKKEDTHRMAEANKAYAHYRW